MSLKSRSITFCLLPLLAASAFAQFDPPGLTAKSRAYHKYRLKETQPPFELAKVLALVKKTPKKDPKNDDDSVVLPKKTFQSLSTRAKFTYCMIHGELYSQNCDGMPAVLNEEQKIFAQPLSPFNGEGTWSPRQTHFLHSHRSEVIRLLRATIKNYSQVGINLKAAIVELNASELIPDMLAIFEKPQKDLDILSVCGVLMSKGHYGPFVHSSLGRKSYGPSANYQTYAPNTAENQRFIIDAAKKFWHSSNS